MHSPLGNKFPSLFFSIIISSSSSTQFFCLFLTINFVWGRVWRQKWDVSGPITALLTVTDDVWKGYSKTKTKADFARIFFNKKDFLTGLCSISSVKVVAVCWHLVNTRLECQMRIHDGTVTTHFSPRKFHNVHQRSAFVWQHKLCHTKHYVTLLLFWRKWTTAAADFLPFAS